jgi:general stress protein 26
MATPEHAAHAADLAAKIKSMRFAMFTTNDLQGHLVSHPMTIQRTDPNGAMWFYTSTLSALWENIAHHPEANLSFVDHEDSLYVSVSGIAERVVDRAQIQAMWNTIVQAWFPAGPDDEHAVLVRVVPHAAEYWDSNDSKMVRMFQIAKAALTGTTPDAGEHGKIDL